MTALFVLSQHLASSFAAETLRAGLLLLVVAVLLRLLPRLAAAARSIIWTGVLLVVTFMPFLPLGFTADPARTAGSAHVLHFAPVWSLAIASLWLLGSFVRGFSLLANAFQLRQIWRSATPIPDTAQLAVTTANGRTRDAALCLSDAITRPSIIGFFSPRVLIPAALYPRLSSIELDHIVLHELEHLRRYDDWRNLLQKVTLVLFPLNPALLWIDRRLAVERELACDESVLESTHAPKSYASCLLHLAQEHAFGRHFSLALGAWERRSELGRRIQGILAYRLAESSGRAQGKSVAGALLAATAMLGAALAHTPQFISFAAPAPAATVGASLRLSGSAPYRTASLHPEARPHMVEAVAHMPTPAPIGYFKRTSRKRLSHAPIAHRIAAHTIVARPLLARPFVLTSWVITYDEPAARELRGPRFTFAVFDPGVPQATPQTFSPDALPTVGNIVIIQL